jgi:hypothetical protein
VKCHHSFRHRRHVRGGSTHRPGGRAIALLLSRRAGDGSQQRSLLGRTKADHDYMEEEALLGENTDLTRMIHQLTQEVHQHLLGNTTTPSTEAFPSERVGCAPSLAVRVVPPNTQRIVRQFYDSRRARLTYRDDAWRSLRDAKAQRRK